MSKHKYIHKFWRFTLLTHHTYTYPTFKYHGPWLRATLYWGFWKNKEVV